MAQVDPLYPVPAKLANDPEAGPYFQFLHRFLHDLWNRTGGGNDLVDSTGQVGDDETITGNWTFSGDNVSSGDWTLDGTWSVGTSWAITGNLTIPEAAVTAHEAALSIAETQIPDGAVLARVGSNETITAIWTYTVQFRTANYTTAARPSPIGVGAQIFDTTLGIPIWWDGTNWIDAAGSTV